MLNTDQTEGIIPLRNRKWRGIEDSDEGRSVLRSRFRESELKKEKKKVISKVYSIIYNMSFLDFQNEYPSFYKSDFILLAK